jgi:putative sterol carrier protein
VRGAIGTPEQVRELVRRYEDAGIDEMLLCVQTGRTRHEHVCEALELFAAEVMPEFAGRRVAREARKQERLAGVIERALARREPPRVVDPDYRFGPTDSGGPSTVPRAASNGSVPARMALRRSLVRRGERAFKSYVTRSDDVRLERTVGSRQGLRVLFGLMAGAYDPERAAGFEGDIQYDLRGSDGVVRPWTVSVDPQRATIRPGRSPSPKLVLKLGIADFVRIAGGDLDPGKALLTGRLDLQGDFSVAMRLGEMFGQGNST